MKMSTFSGWNKNLEQGQKSYRGESVQSVEDKNCLCPQFMLRIPGEEAVAFEVPPFIWLLR